jgi:hypothetical protein
MSWGRSACNDLTRRERVLLATNQKPRSSLVSPPQSTLLGLLFPSNAPTSPAATWIPWGNSYDHCSWRWAKKRNSKSADCQVHSCVADSRLDMMKRSKKLANQQERQLELMLNAKKPCILSLRAQKQNVSKFVPRCTNAFHLSSGMSCINTFASKNDPYPLDHISISENTNRQASMFMTTTTRIETTVLIPIPTSGPTRANQHPLFNQMVASSTIIAIVHRPTYFCRAVGCSGKDTSVSRLHPTC